jgi:site-specific DNA recombinase
VLTILRNRAYLGEINYRRSSYPAPHQPLVDKELFEREQVILRERGENASLRRSNRSDYLLTGLLKCARCGKRYIGACAHGNGGRYPYYVCFSRQRYGKTTCDADSLPADELEHAVLDQFVSILEQEPLVRQAIEQAFADLDAGRRNAKRN